MEAMTTARLVSQDTHDQPMYQYAVHRMGFAIGSPVGTRHDTSYTMVTTRDFLETTSVLEII